MVAPIHEESVNTILVVQTARRDGFYLAMLPDGIDAEQVDAAFQEAGISPRKVGEVKDWRETSCGLCVTFVPVPLRD